MTPRDINTHQIVFFLEKMSKLLKQKTIKDEKEKIEELKIKM